MSAFGGENQNPSDQNQDKSVNQSYLDQLVQQRGEQFRDPEALAKSKIEADKHIQNLEDQLSNLREDLGKQDYAKEVVALLQENKAPSPTGGNNPEAQNNGGTNKEEKPSPGVSEDDLKRLVEDAITGREKSATAQQNLRQADSQLEEMFGTEAEAKVKEKANELGMSVERMKALAEESPGALVNLMGGKPKEEYRPMVNGSVNPQANASNNQSNVRDMAYYMKMRKEDRATFYRPETQRQMVKDLAAVVGS